MMNIESMETAMPGMLSNKDSGKIDSSKYRIRCVRADISDAGELLALEEIMTQGLDGKDIVIIEKDKYSFQDRYFIVVTYLEKRNAS